MRYLLTLALLCCALAPRFATAQDVVAQGDPPLTSTMVKDYMRLIQWTLDTPLTLAQEEKLRANLTTAWQVNDRDEINRVLNLLALRQGLEQMHLQDDPLAKKALQKDALHGWNRNPSSDIARWGLPMFDASHKSLIEGPDPFTRQMADAYLEMGTFIIGQVYGDPSNKLDVEERVQLSDALAGSFRSMTPEQKANFAKIPALWVQLRNAWPSLTDPEKAALKADWKAHFEPKPAAPAKGAKTAPPARLLPAVGLFGRLARMTWLTNKDEVTKLAAVGGDTYAYKSGW